MKCNNNHNFFPSCHIDNHLWFSIATYRQIDNDTWEEKNENEKKEKKIPKKPFHTQSFERNFTFIRSLSGLIHSISVCCRFSFVVWYTYRSFVTLLMLGLVCCVHSRHTIIFVPVVDTLSHKHTTQTNSNIYAQYRTLSVWLLDHTQCALSLTLWEMVRVCVSSIYERLLGVCVHLYNANHCIYTSIYTSIYTCIAYIYIYDFIEAYILKSSSSFLIWMSLILEIGFNLIEWIQTNYTQSHKIDRIYKYFAMHWFIRFNYGKH